LHKLFRKPLPEETFGKRAIYVPFAALNASGGVNAPRVTQVGSNLHCIPASLSH